MNKCQLCIYSDGKLAPIKLLKNLGCYNSFSCEAASQQLLCSLHEIKFPIIFFLSKLKHVLEFQTAVADHISKTQDPSSTANESSLSSNESGLSIKSLISLCSLSIPFWECSPGLVQASEHIFNILLKRENR